MRSLTSDIEIYAYCIVAYMYLGLAIRTCLSAGFNREVRNPKDQRESWISKTWWYVIDHKQSRVDTDVLTGVFSLWRCEL